MLVLTRSKMCRLNTKYSFNYYIQPGGFSSQMREDLFLIFEFTSPIVGGDRPDNFG